MSNNELTIEILDLLIKRQQKRISKLFSIQEIATELGFDHEIVDAQVRILDSLGALKSNRTLDGSSSPFLLDAGYLLYEQLTTELAIQKPDPSTTDENVSLNFSDDYANVVWEGKTFTFNKTQALCVRILHEEFLNQLPSLHLYNYELMCDLPYQNWL